MNHITVKFTGTDEEKFKEFKSKVINALGNEEFSDGVYVEMVSVSDLSQQIDDINEILTNDYADQEKLIEIGEVLSRI